MKTIAIVSQKGGAGKTSLAINLAAAALESNLSAVIADTDTQQSAYNWFKERADNTLPYVISSYPDSLPAYIETARQEGADYFIIDTAPQSSEPAVRIAQLADIILVPTRPSEMDLRALERTMLVLRLADNPPAFAVINACPTYGNEPDDAEDALRSAGLDVLPNRIHDRADIRRAIALDQTVFEYAPGSKAAIEFSALYKAVARQVFRIEQQQKKLQTRKETRRHVL